LRLRDAEQALYPAGLKPAASGRMRAFTTDKWSAGGSVLASLRILRLVAAVKPGHPHLMRTTMHASRLSSLLVHVPPVLLTSLACTQTGDTRTGAAAEAGSAAAGETGNATAGKVRTGAAAFDDWKGDAPGVRRHIRPSDLPAPQMAASGLSSEPAKRHDLPRYPQVKAS
jgi:hypothetical protein